MTQDQFLSLLRAVLLIAGTFLITTATHKGWISGGDWETLTGAVLTIVPLVWSMFAHAPSKSTREMVGSTK